MPNNHRVVINSITLPFATYPIELVSSTPFVVNYVISSTGGAIRSLGRRIYDTNILPSSGTIVVQPNSPATFPFITTQLPQTYFDAVFLLLINNDRYIQGFSNSPDNVAAYSSNYFLEEKKMFGVFLKCYSPNGGEGDYEVNNHYMFGGENSDLNALTYLKMVFDAPTPAPVTMTPKITFCDSLNGVIGPTLTLSSVIIPTGSIDFNFPGFNLYVEYFFNTGYYNYDKLGYYKVEFIPSDSSFVSILPFYHWGQF